MVSRRDFIRTGAAAWGAAALAPLAGCIRPGAAHALSIAEFATPPLAARPMVLWSWLNGYVDHAQLTRELEEMAAKGLRGPIIWDVGAIIDPEGMIPTGPPFLGEESVEAIGHALDVASRLGLEVGLFSSSSWNAGGPWIGPELASKQLAWAEHTVQGPGRFEGALPEPEGVVGPLTEVALLAVPADASRGETANLSGHVNAEGRIAWEVPPGEWTILRFVCAGTGQPLEIPSPASNGLMADHLSEHATDRHFGTIFDRLAPLGDRLKPMRLMMLDSFEVWERPDWTPGFDELFRTEFGYDPVPYLPEIAGKTIHAPEVRDRFLHDYRVLVSRVMIGNHFARSGALLEGQGMQLLAEAGHGGYPRVDPLQALGAAHIPMGEFWNGSQFWVTKEAASAAHIYGRTDVAAEALTGWRHWKDGPAEYRRLYDIAYCAGLTMGVFHTFAHNPPEAGKPGFAYHAGEHFNVNSTWWDQAGPMVEYLARCSHLLRQGRFVADVCFYYGDDAPGLVPSRRIDPKVVPRHPEGTCQHCGRPMPNRVESLGPGYDYDYVNRDIVLNDMRVRDGLLTLSSGMEYGFLVMPDRDDIALPVLRRLDVLVREGATLVGRPPQRANSLEGYPECDAEVQKLVSGMWPTGDPAIPRAVGKGRVYGDVPLRGILGSLVVRPDFTVESPDSPAIDYIHRRTENEDVYFVTNSADEPVDAECSFRVDEAAAPSFWNPVDGSVTPCPVYRREDGRTRVPIRLAPASSIFVVFARDSETEHVVGIERSDTGAVALVVPDLEVLACSSSAVRVRARSGGSVALRTNRGRSATFELPAPPPDLPLSGPWTLRFPEGKGAPDRIDLDALVSWTELEPEGARVFSGTAIYETTFEVPSDYLVPDRSVSLDLGRVAEVADVSINGEPAGLLWCPPYTMDVTDRVHAGTNRLEIRVTNVWHNRIVGDLRYPNAGEFARTNIKNRFRAEMELLPSGLMGPVVLQAAGVVEGRLG